MRLSPPSGFRRSLWLDASRVKVTVNRGVVTLAGQMDRRSNAHIAARSVLRVNGVVEVIDELKWDEDDTPSWEDR
ncbi:BON domain-containing protein [Sphaerisporangium perillae]|uniref:BON domain-containing protein n=1 Tax=Sphaerisporangium perillae TaxID=2935860 RepID=UPI00200E1AC7|nr:BON domain-containing protein [Sphaerisporangium perillae]